MQQLGLGTADDAPATSTLPKQVGHVRVPPIKCQGIKTKLVPFILGSIKWDGEGRWIEPFVGSGVVALNASPLRAYLTDANVHVIRFYRDIAYGSVTAEIVREHLRTEGRLLAERGSEHYYHVRDRFNDNPTSLDFLFLNRSCFNGVMRFNSKGRFNVPFCKKPERFRQAYVTKIANQVSHLESVMGGCDWRFEAADWRECLAQATADDFVYADPPYAGRHTDYFTNWTEQQEEQLLFELRQLPCGFALSTWKGNKYRSNLRLPWDIAEVVIRTTEHFYHVGATERLRNPMTEALILKRDSVRSPSTAPSRPSVIQADFAPSSRARRHLAHRQNLQDTNALQHA